MYIYIYIYYVSVSVCVGLFTSQRSVQHQIRVIAKTMSFV